MMYHKPQAVVEANGRRSGAFGDVRDRAVGPAVLPPVSPSLCPSFGAPAPKA